MGDTSDDESLAALPTGVSVKPLRTIAAKRRFFYLLSIYQNRFVWACYLLNLR